MTVRWWDRSSPNLWPRAHWGPFEVRPAVYWPLTPAPKSSVVSVPEVQTCASAFPVPRSPFRVPPSAFPVPCSAFRLPRSAFPPFLWPVGAIGDETDKEPPKIELAFAKRRITVAQSSFLLEGLVQDPSGVARVTVNNEVIRLPKMKLPAVAFSRSVRLELGANTIHIVASDRNSNESRVTVQIERKLPEIFLSASRYSVAVSPLAERGPQIDRSRDAHQMVLRALIEKPIRFRPIERNAEVLSMILQELELSAIADPRTAVRVGKLVSAEGMLFGSVLERQRSVTMDLRLVDTESGQVLHSTDVYTEDKSYESLRQLAYQLVAKLKAEFPLLQARVDRVKGGKVFVDKGEADGLSQCLKLLLYREVESDGVLLPVPIKLPDGRPAQARVADVGPNWASAELLGKGAAGLVKAGDKVITK